MAFLEKRSEHRRSGDVLARQLKEEVAEISADIGKLKTRVDSLEQHIESSNFDDSATVPPMITKKVILCAVVLVAASMIVGADRAIDIVSAVLR